MATTKTVTFRGVPFEVEGVGPDDPYFRNLSDGTAADFDAVFSKIVEHDYVCLDIGANIGVASLALAKCATSGRVVAVEAAPGVAKILKRNTAGASNISVVHSAVTDVDGEIGFHEHSAFGRIAEGGATVPAKTFGSILADHGGKVDFVKIDVEGHEFTILKNALDIINENRAIVLLEFNSWCLMAHAGVAPLDFANWIFENFKFCFAVHDGRFVRVTSAYSFVHENVVRDNSVTDILVTNAPERLVGLLDEAADTKRDLTALTAQVAPLVAERDALRAALIETQHKLAEAVAENFLIKRSRSWKLTEPLRHWNEYRRRQ